MKENMRLRRINSTIREQKQEQEEEQDDHNVIRAQASFQFTNHACFITSQACDFIETLQPFHQLISLPPIYSNSVLHSSLLA